MFSKEVRLHCQPKCTRIFHNPKVLLKKADFLSAWVCKKREGSNHVNYSHSKESINILNKIHPTSLQRIPLSFINSIQYLLGVLKSPVDI